MEGDSQREWSDLIGLVIQHFQTLSRGPYKTDQAQQLAKADANSTQGIILSESELAWRAYYAAKKATESQHGFAGKAVLIRLFDSLDSQSIEEQRAFAKKFALAMENEASQTTESNGVTCTAKRAKRRRICPIL